jgi:polysaccharide biosynthesis transport protein
VNNSQVIAAERNALSSRFRELLPPHDEASSLTWEQCVRVLRKQRWFMFATIGVLTAGISVAAFLLRDVYEPMARLEIDPVGGGIRTLHEIENPRSEADSEYLDTQVQVLQSDALAMRVIRSLKLDQNPEFVSSSDLLNASSRAPLGSEKITASYDGSFLQEQLELANATAAESRALRTFHKKLYVNPIRSSRLVEVAFAAHEPHLAQAITNALVSQFIEQNYRNRYLTTMEASDWLSTQLNDLRGRVTESNRAVADYQRKYGLVESDERDVPLAQLMAEMSRQLSDAHANRVQAEAFSRMAENGQAELIPAVRDDVVYQNLLGRYTDVRAKLAQAQAVYGDDNTNVKKLQNEANELSREVDSERMRLIDQVRASFAAALDRERLMTESREKVRAQMGDASSHLVEYRMLKNEAVANATLYNTLEGRLREAGIYAGLRSGNIHVVDMAPRLAQATGPHRALIVFIGTTISIMAAFVLAFVRESFDNTVRIPDDIRNWTNLPSLAVLPAVGPQNGAGQRNLSGLAGWNAQGDQGRHVQLQSMIWSEPQSEAAEAIRSLRGALLISTPVVPQVILVSSANSGDGKTTVALNLARVLAQQGETCLVEGDLRSPAIASAMDLNPKAGLTELLRGEAALTEALVSAGGMSNFTVLPVKSAPENPADLLASPQMHDVLAGLRKAFRYLVIDSPPLIPFSDARSLAQLSDAVVIVSRYGSTTRRAITRCVELLSGVNARVMGVVLNDMDFSSADYHYFNYGYSRRLANHKYEYSRMRFTASSVKQSGRDGSPPEKSRGAHA